MTFTTLTTQNQAVQQLVKTGAARLSGIGEATLAIPAGRYRFAFTVPLLASPAPEVTVRVYDSSSGDKAEVKVLTASASIADYDSPDIASENRAFWRSHNNTKIGYSFEVELPEPTGEYVLRIDTGAATGQDGTALDLTWEHTYFPAIPDGTVVRDDLEDPDTFFNLAPAAAGATNYALGPAAGYSMVDGATYNWCVGISAGTAITTGDGNTAGGYQAGYSSTTGSSWTALGYHAGYSSTTGSDWTAVGRQAGYSSTTGGSWTAQGFQAGFRNTTGSQWTAVGLQAGYSSTTGSSWTALGYQAGRNNTTGSYWSALGYRAGYSNTTGSTNCFVGYRAGYASTTASSQTVVGSWEATGYETTGGIVALAGGTTLRFFFDGTDYFFGAPGSINLPTSAPATIGALWSDSGTVKIVIA